MQLWVSKLNKNKWKIALIILSIAVATSCVFGATFAWINNVEHSYGSVSVDVNYVDIFSNGTDSETYVMIPGQSHAIVSPNVLVREDKGYYCVFAQVSEVGGVENHTYLEYTAANGWYPLSAQQAATFKFPQKEETTYFYQTIDASLVDHFPVLNSTVTVNKDTTYEQINAATTAAPVKLVTVAAGCKTSVTPGSATLPSATEVEYAQVYTAFI